MASNFGNSGKRKFIGSLPTESIESGDLVSRSKFNFSYFDSSQRYASDFSALTSATGFLEKIRSYSRFSLTHWRSERVGRSGRNVLEVYGGFPKKSEFTHPKHVPHDVMWGRFRLESDTRLVGFILPPDYSGKISGDGKLSYCCNTFYVVFIDLSHKFYLT